MSPTQPPSAIDDHRASNSTANELHMLYRVAHALTSVEIVYVISHYDGRAH